MGNLINKGDGKEAIKALELEIEALERELAAVETEINTFGAHIRSALSEEINQINILTALYKQLKQAKKNKRLQQKQKGKNYKATQSPAVLKKEGLSQKQDSEDAHSLKKLYKEAVMLVHPDKFEESDADAKERAHDLTAELIGVYKSGDLERLVALHEHIMSGNAMSHVSFDAASVVDHNAMEVYLQTKKDTLSKALEDLKTSYLFEVLQNYPHPPQFIEELRPQFAYRIVQLQKRTRKA